MREHGAHVAAVPQNMEVLPLTGNGLTGGSWANRDSRDSGGCEGVGGRFSALSPHAVLHVIIYRVSVPLSCHIVYLYEIELLRRNFSSNHSRDIPLTLT